MDRTGKALRIVLIAAAAVVAAMVVVFFLFTRTDFGVEQAGRFAVDRLRGSIDGQLRVGLVTSRGLLRGVTLHDVAIDDAEGRPFLRADSARLAYHLTTILGGDVAFDRLIVYSPVVHIEKLPGQERWNYERIFPGDTLAPDTTAGGLIQIDDATIHDGRVYVRFPWEADPPVEPDDTARLILESVPGGLARVLRFEGVNGRIPRMIWETPGDDAKVIQIGELSTRAYIWEEPVDIRRLRGTLTIRDSILSFAAPEVELPSSALEMVGRIILAEEGNRYDIEAAGDDLAFADFQWLYPRLPATGGGALEFRMQSQGAENILWLAREARLRTEGTEVAGSFGVVTGDTLYFTNVDLEASPLDLELLRSLLPGELPLEGLLIGTVEVEGPISALDTRGDLRYRRPGRRSESAVKWEGTLRARRPLAVRGLDADLRSVDLAQLAVLIPGLKLRGIATGRLHADGSIEEGLRLNGELALERNGTRSLVRGGGELAVGGNRSRFDLRFDAAPLALELVAAQYPALRLLTGEATGPVTVTGSLDDLRVDADIITPAGGVILNGAFALDGETPRYRAEGAVTDFRLDRVVGGIPEMTVTARFDVDGRGDRPEELEGRLALDVFSAVVDGVPVHGGTLRLAAADGLARLDTLDLRTRVGDLAAAGTFGLAPGRAGALAFTLRADSLAGLADRLLPPATVPDTAFLPPPRLAGLVTADGTLRGALDAFTLAGDVIVRNGVADHVSARRIEASAAWTPAERRLVLTGSVDSLAARGRILPAGRIDGQYVAGAGQLAIDARGPGSQALQLAGTFARAGRGARFQVHRLTIDTRDGHWELADSLAGRVGPSGIGIEPMVIARAADGARVELGGILPWTTGDPSGPATIEAAAFTAAVENLRIGEVLRLVQVDTVAGGTVNGRVSVTGTALAPVIEGTLLARDVRYLEARVDSVSARITYADRALGGTLAAWEGGDAILTGGGTLPLDLALTDLEDRFVDRPIDLRFTGDSIPAGLVGFLAPGFSRVAGTVTGRLKVAGTPAVPSFQGELYLQDGTGYFEHSAVRYRNVQAAAYIADTELTIEALVGTSRGQGEITGTIDLADPADPGFDLRLIARQLDATLRRDVVAVADGTVYLTGRWSAPILSGAVRLTQGELNLDEVLRQYRIVQLEPWFYEVLDTTALAFAPPEQTPFLANLRVSDATVIVDRGFWLRGPELNAEVTGELDVEYDRAAEDLRMSGTLEAVRGTYELRVLQNADHRLLRDLPGRRFEIRDGTIEFVGTPGIDPNLAIAATYRVRRRQGEPIDVVAEVAGTLQAPRVRLTSESDIPISESELASYIIFGRSLAELSQAESDVVAQSTAGEALFFSSLVVPTVSGIISSTFQSMLGVDYLALTFDPDEWRFANLGKFGNLAFLQDAQLEVGTYAGGPFSDVFLVGAVRMPRPGSGEQGFLNQFGVRAEWRFSPTWTSEFFVEDRFARTPSFGLQEIEDRRVLGLSLVREWGY